MKTVGRLSAMVAVGATVVGATLQWAPAGDASPTRLPATPLTAGPAIKVGVSAKAIAITPDGKTAYVTISGLNTVIPVNLATGTAGPAIKVVQGPDGIAITPNGETAYVSSYAVGGTVTPINIATGKPGTPIKAGISGQGVAITPDGKTAYVLSGTDGGAPGTVVPVNIANGAPGRAIEVGSMPDAIAITPNGKTAYVVAAGNKPPGTVTPVNLVTNTAGRPIKVGFTPTAIAITPNGKTAYVVNGGIPGSVVPINTATNTPGPPIKVGDSPTAIAITPNGSTAYVVNWGLEPAAGTVVAINTSTNTTGPFVSVGVNPDGIAITPNGATAYVPNYTSGTVTVLHLPAGAPAPPTSPGPPSSPTPVGAVPQCLAYDLAVSPGKPEDGLGHEGLTLLFRNVSPGPCVIFGYPGVAALNSKGQQAVQAVRTPRGYLGGLANGQAKWPVVELSSGQYASALVEGDQDTTGSSSSCPSYPALLVTPPDTTTSVRVSTASISGGLSGCSTIYVHPVVSGTSGVQTSS
jgi:DNA-binding beta-propeller fold protein YncE